MVVENGPDVGNVVWNINAFGFADAFQSPVLVQQFETGLGAHAADAGVEIRAS